MSDASEQASIDHARQAPWQPGGTGSRAPRVLVGVAGAAIVAGAVAAIVMLSPSAGPAKHATTDQVASAQVARDPATQINREPPAAGAMPADTDTRSDAATAPSATGPSPSDTAPAAAATPAPEDTAASAVMPPPALTPPSSTDPQPGAGSTSPTRGE